jgi:hypothetical protein
MNRKPFSELQQLSVWKSDGWHCRYCLAPVFFMRSVQLLDEMNPGHGYYHGHGKYGATLELFACNWATVDHVAPVVRGGGNDTANLVTACNRCNIKKSAGPDGCPKPISPEIRQLNWDGFALLYIPLRAQLLKAEDRWVRAIRNVYSLPEPRRPTTRSS